MAYLITLVKKEEGFMQYWDVILDALIDTAKLLPLLFIVYYIIELIEYKYALKFQNNKFLKGKASPVIGALLGCVPQCGFSVVTTDFYSRGSVSIGALIAVYIATSDEAIPLMISNPDSILWLLALIGIKIVLAILIGYFAMYLYKVIFEKCCINKESIRNISRQISDKLDSLSVREVYTILNGIDLYIQEKTYKGNILEFNTKSPFSSRLTVYSISTGF